MNVTGQKTKNKSMRSHMTKFVLGTFMSQFITLVAGILARRFLGPLQTGIWSLLQVILNYTQYASFGAMNATLREIPFYRGKGDNGKVTNIQNSSFSFSMLTSLIIAVLLTVYAFAARGYFSETFFYGLLFASTLVILRRINDLLITLLRAYKHFGFASKQMVLSSMVNSVLIVFLSYRFRIYGYVTAMIISLGFNIVYIMMHEKNKFKWTMDFLQIKELISYGMPLVLLGVMSTVLLSIDKIMIAKMIGLRELGLYSIAVMSYRYLSTFPNAVGNVLIPNLHEKYGQYNDAKKLEGILSRTASFLSNLSPVIIGFVWFFIPYIVNWVLPEFEECVPASKILVVGSFFLAINNPYAHYVIAIRKHIKLIPVMIVVSVGAFLVNYMAISNGFGINGVAFGTLLVLFFRFVFTYFLANLSFSNGAIVVKRFFVIIMKFVYMVSVFVVVQRLVPDHKGLMISVGYRIFITQLLFIPFLVSLEREFKVFERVVSKILKFRG